MSIQAVLFDLDNTLTHRDLSVQAYSQFLINEFQSSLNHTDQTQVDKTIEIVRRIDNGGYPKKELLTQPSIAGSVADALIAELDWHQKPNLDHLTQFWFEQFGLSAVPMEGAEALLKKLKNNHYTLAVISNGGHATRLKILEGLGFTQYFDRIFSSELVGVSKPKPEIFLHSCAELGVDPQHSLYIGDHPINDYQGAQSAGLNALLLEGFHPLEHYIDQPPKRIQHLNQVLDYV